MERIYLASPYTHPDENVRRNRVKAVRKLTGKLISTGNHVFSPIAYGHLFVKDCDFDDNYWYDWSMSFLQHWATVLCVYTLEGWQESRGIINEIKYAESVDMPVIYL